MLLSFQAQVNLDQKKKKPLNKVNNLIILLDF